MSNKYIPGLSSKSYISVPQAEDDDLNTAQRPQRSLRARVWPGWVMSFWIFMALFFATTVWLTAELHSVRKQGSFAKGFRKELG
jgi:hypothetical protein